MNAAAAQYDLPVLLELSGAKPAGPRRHNCSKCGGKRTVTHTDEVFYCHRCQWRGNAVTLAKELGLDRRVCSAEYRELCQNRERAARAAAELYERIKARRFELVDELHSFNRLELQAHEAGPDHPATWDALALVYRERPGVLAELAILENGAAADLLRFLSSGADDRKAVIDRILRLGGLPAKRRMDCFHCCTSVPLDRRNVGRCSGPCWRRCSGTCLVCSGSCAVLCETLIEVMGVTPLGQWLDPHNRRGYPAAKERLRRRRGPRATCSSRERAGKWKLDAASFVGGSAGLARQRLSEKDQV